MNHDEQAIRQLVATWAEATKHGDVQKVLELMADDVVFLVAGQSPMNKAAFEAAMKAQASNPSARPKIESTSEIQEIEIVGDCAYMWTQLKVVVTPPGESAAITRGGHTLTILRKQAGRWVIARDANMLTLVNKI